MFRTWKLFIRIFRTWKTIYWNNKNPENYLLECVEHEYYVLEWLEPVKLFNRIFRTWKTI